MTRAHSEIYSEIYDAYRRWAGSSVFLEFFLWRPIASRNRGVGVVTDALEDAIRELGLRDRMRSDARHFLLINVHQMLILPLSHPDAEGWSSTGLREDLDYDMRILLAEAAQGADGRDVSVRTLVEALASCWPRLRLASRRGFEKSQGVGSQKV
jgi:hypothetical protein